MIGVKTANGIYLKVFLKRRNFFLNTPDNGTNLIKIHKPT